MKRLIVINDDTLCRTELDSDFRFSSRDVLPQLLITLAVKDSSSHRVGHPIAAEDVRTARLATMEDLLDFRALKGNTRAMNQQERETYLSPDKLHELAISLFFEHCHLLKLFSWHVESFGEHEKRICQKQDAHHNACRAFSESLQKIQDIPFAQLNSQGIELIKAIGCGVDALAVQPLHAGMTPIPPLVEEQRGVLKNEGDIVQRSLFNAVEHHYLLRARHQCLLDIWRLNHRTEVLKNTTQSTCARMQLIEYDYELVRTMLANKGHDIEAIWTAEVQSAFLSCRDEYFERINEMESVFGSLVSNAMNSRNSFIAQNGRFRH